jgi:hypothetical protein
MKRFDNRAEKMAEKCCVPGGNIMILEWLKREIKEAIAHP